MSGHDGDDGTSLLSLPNEVFLYDLLPLLSPKDLASLSQVNKQLHDLVVRHRWHEHAGLTSRRIPDSGV